MITFDFSNRNIIVTGAAGSIGRAIVNSIVECGGNVYGMDIDKATLIEMEAELGNEKFHARCIDLSSAEVIREAVKAVISEVGQLHGLVNCVGILCTTPFAQVTQAEWDKVISINLTGVFAATQEAFTHMCENRYGRIVNVSSVAGKVGGGLMGRSAYATSKAGLNGMTKCVAKEGGKYNVSCNCVCPGWTDSRMINPLMDDNDTERIRAMVALGRPATPQEAANPILFYLSDLASFVTGEISNVDGGVVYDG